MIKRNRFLLIVGLLGGGLFGSMILMAVLGKGANTQLSVDTDGDNQSQPVVLEVNQQQVEVLRTFDDSSEDSLRTVGAAYESTTQKQAQLEHQLSDVNVRLDTELNEQKQAHEHQVAALNSQIETLAQRLNTALSGLDQKLAQTQQTLTDKQRSIRHSNVTEDYARLGINSPRQGALDESAEWASQSQAQGLIWSEPLDAHKNDEGDWVTPALESVKSMAAHTAQQGKSAFSTPFDVNANEGLPLYTLHRGSVLSDAVSMTALMGRIPINGQVTDPYPFSMIVGGKNLLANGFTLPELQGAIVTGTVTGDWSLSCVRGVVESIDFILADGQVVSYPDTKDSLDSGFDGSGLKTMGLGFLADPNGNPCLSGLKISNAPEYLTSKGLLDAASAAANAAALAQQTVTVDGGSSTSALTGSAAVSAAGKSAAAFTTTVSDFIDSRMGASFDIIYVEPVTKAAIHLRQPITFHKPHPPVNVRYVTHTQENTYALP